jgi:hypothetical protein
MCIHPEEDFLILLYDVVLLDRAKAAVRPRKGT